MEILSRVQYKRQGALQGQEAGPTIQTVTSGKQQTQNISPGLNVS